MNKIKNILKITEEKGPVPETLFRYWTSPAPSSALVRGFTMIELLVSISVFTFIIAITSGIFTTSLRSHRASVALLAANSDAQLTLEQMARVIRRGDGKTFTTAEGTDVKNNNYRCLKFKSGNDFIAYRWNRSDKSIEWHSKTNDVLNYLTYCENPPENAFSSIISENLRVDTAYFRVDDNAVFYPKITILLRVGSNATRVASAPFTNLEVTISPRSDKRD